MWVARSWMGWLMALVFAGLGMLVSASDAQAQHCKGRYGEAFQLISGRSFAGQSQAEIEQAVATLFGPRQEVCGEVGYRLFVRLWGAYAKDALRRKGAEQLGAIQVAQEILRRFPVQVRWDGAADKGSLLLQLRSDLAVIADEVGRTPPVEGLLRSVLSLQPPTQVAKKVTIDETGLQATVPRTPLPPWAVISLYEIDEHLQHREYGSAQNKVRLILQWMKLVASGTPPQDIQLRPVPDATQAPTP